MTEKTLIVSKIRDGTVIDHITRGHALDVLRVLDVNGKKGETLAIAINVPSRKIGVKDMVKFEGRELKSEEVDKIALLAPNATINIIREYDVVEKQVVKLPNVLKGIVKCVNPTCISNSKEPIQSTLTIKQEDPFLAKCHYCGYAMEKNDLLKQF
jgi:aspartate carbamoyltransferase regulatory subunit